MELTNIQEYKDFFEEIRTIVETARYDAFKSVNAFQIRQNFDIGHSIVKRQNKFGWGKSVVERLSKDLTRIIICDATSWSSSLRNKGCIYNKIRVLVLGQWFWEVFWVFTGVFMLLKHKQTSSTRTHL